MTSLSPAALTMINQYLHLPIPGHDIRAPYFNNRRSGARGALRATIGKGTPQEIIEEAEILARRAHLNIADLTNEELTKFFVDNRLGIDCSGLIYHVLDTELQTQGKGPIKKYLRFSGSFLRRCIARLRPAQNTSVAVLAASSTPVELSNIQAGDLIIIQGAGKNHDRDHVLLIHKTDREGKGGVSLHYTHSFQWSTDGLYGHGVRQGTIHITDPNKAIIEQPWTEEGKTDDINETWCHAREAQKIELKRLL